MLNQYNKKNHAVSEKCTTLMKNVDILKKPMKPQKGIQKPMKQTKRKKIKN